MGGKITIDSATLMNKGLELIEAHHLFGTPYERIDVVVHPQSIIHSLVQLCDGATLAHLGYPDMRVPISHALHYPGASRRAGAAARPRRARLADVRGAGPRHIWMPAAGARGRDRRRHRPVHAERRQRGGRARVPRRSTAVPRDRGGDRGDAQRAAGAPVHSFESLGRADGTARRVAGELVQARAAA